MDGEQRLMLSVHSLSHGFGEGDLRIDALVDVEFDVLAGEMVAVVGPSGSGKSTLLHVLSGIERIQHGRVSVDGSELAGLADRELHRYRRRTVGMVFQNFNLFGMLTAAENVALPLELDSAGRTAAMASARGALAAVGMEALGHRFPDQLSGGQQQRVAIARSLIGGAKVLLADEPTGALDSKTGGLVLDLLRSRVATGVSVVVVTHDQRVAAGCDRIIELRDGRLVDNVA